MALHWKRQEVDNTLHNLLQMQTDDIALLANTPTKAESSAA